MRFFMGLAAAVVIAGTAAAQQAGPTVILFGHKAASSDQAALAQFNELAVQMRGRSDYSFVVVGHADASEGSEDTQLALSERRAAVVRDSLVARGIPAGVIVTRASGASQPAVAGPGHAENRRAEVTIHLGGW